MRYLALTFTLLFLTLSARAEKTVQAMMGEFDFNNGQIVFHEDFDVGTCNIKLIGAGAENVSLQITDSATGKKAAMLIRGEIVTYPYRVRLLDWNNRGYDYHTKSIEMDATLTDRNPKGLIYGLQSASPLGAPAVVRETSYLKMKLSVPETRVTYLFVQYMKTVAGRLDTLNKIECHGHVR